MNIQELQKLLNSGEFHHATLRLDLGLMSGLKIYRREDNGFNGFMLAGSFRLGDEEQAMSILRSAGTSYHDGPSR